MRNELAEVAPRTMLRNILLMFSTVALLALLFGGYWVFLRSPSTESWSATEFHENLPTQIHGDSQTVFAVAGVELPAGGGMEFTVYDERTGQPTESFRCESYTFVPGSKNEILVTQPTLIMRLPSGMIATITAAEGQIAIDRVDNSRARPKRGWLEGDATIRLQREPRQIGKQASASLAGDMLIRMNRLEFDLDAGSMRTTDDVEAEGEDLTIAGRGLTLVWNQAENRIEQFVIKQGRWLAFSTLASLVGPAEPDGPAAAAAQPPDGRSATPAAGARPAGLPSGTTYKCSLAGTIDIQHFRSEPLSHGAGRTTLVGGMQTDSLELLFDVGGGRDLLGPGSGGRRTARGGVRPADRIVVAWNGPLTIIPVGTPPADQPARRHVAAWGSPVTLVLPDGRVQCGTLRYFDESGRLWLLPDASGIVEFDLGPGLRARAQNVYYDRAAGVIKLIGDVRLTAGRGDRFSVRCALWAELQLASTGAESSFSGGIGSGELRSARFVGQVRLDRGRETLEADELTARFAAAAAPLADDAAGPPAAAASLDNRLERAEALGSVRLVSGRQSLDAGWLSATFARGAEGVSHPRDVQARGAVALRDLDERLLARGRHLTARLTPEGDLDQATIYGWSEAPARVVTDTYIVHGAQIELRAADRVVRVPGAAELKFRTQRSLQGHDRGRLTVTTVTCRQSLEIDLRQGAGEIRFAGEVDARNSSERLLSDSLVLELEDVDERRAPAGPSDSGPALRDAAGLLLGRSTAAAMFSIIAAQRNARAVLDRALGREPQEGTRLAGRSVGRKELRRIVAHNAVVQSEEFVAGDDQPLVHQSIAAPELQISVPQRVIRTIGATSLYLVDRRLEPGQSAPRASLGVPSALLTSGPSQTVLRSEKSMLYAIGPDGPQRVDRVVFEGGVRFRHVAGREMIGLERLLPQLASQPELLNKLETRNTYLESDRLEVELISAGDSGGRSALRLGGLSAAGHVYLRDQQAELIRSLQSAQLEFDRVQSIVRVLGGDGIDARVYNENTLTGRMDVPVVGPEILIDLQSNTVRTKAVSGEFQSGRR